MYEIGANLSTLPDIFPPDLSDIAFAAGRARLAATTRWAWLTKVTWKAKSEASKVRMPDQDLHMSRSKRPNYCSWQDLFLGIYTFFGGEKIPHIKLHSSVYLIGWGPWGGHLRLHPSGCKSCQLHRAHKDSRRSNWRRIQWDKLRRCWSLWLLTWHLVLKQSNGKNRKKKKKKKLLWWVCTTSWPVAEGAWLARLTLRASRTAAVASWLACLAPYFSAG